MLYLETVRYGCNMPCIVVWVCFIWRQGDTGVYSGMGMLYLETGRYGCNMPCIVVWVCFIWRQGDTGVTCLV